MPTSKTKELAKKLGLVKTKRKCDSGGCSSNPKKRKKGQLLSYVIVIDFESTCWKDKRGAQEIIEFPAVLLDLCTGEIVAEFQHYVQPQENPRLSDFCRELTGITQDQVNNGIPLPTCLMLFNLWLKKLREERGVQLMEPGKEYSEEMTLSALATWTDWDLEVCLTYECRRKQIRKQAYFSQWIDLRAVYKNFYDRRPSGLSGALEDLGIAFTGRQHSGIDDARNTAKLCYRLVRDGCKLSITKCIHRKSQPTIIRPPTSQHSSSSSLTLNKASGTNDSGSTTVSESPRRLSEHLSSKLEALREKKTSMEDDNAVKSATSDTVNTNLCQLSPKSSGTHPKPLLPSEGGATDDTFPESEQWSIFDDEFIKNVAQELDQWESEGISRQQEAGVPSSCSTIKDKGLSGTNDKVLTAPKPAPPLFSRAGDVDIVCRNGHTSSHMISVAGNTLGTFSSSGCYPSVAISTHTPSRTQFISHVAPVTLLQPSSSNQSSNGQVIVRASPCLSTGSSCTKTILGTRPIKTPPGMINQMSNTIQSYSKASSSINELFSPTIRLDDAPLVTTNQKHSPLQQNYCKPPGGASELQTPSPCSTSAVFRTPSTAEWMKVKKTTLTPLTSSREPLMTLNGGKVTPPLCNCGKRAKRKLVTSPGPNEGKPFYVCPRGRGSDCGYFRWECSSPCGTSAKGSCSLSLSSYSSLGQSPEILCSEYPD